MNPDRGGPPAILLGGDFTALAVARSLAIAGVSVHALGSPLDPVRHSRFCAEFVEASDDVQGRWLDYLEGAAPGSVVLPCSDDGLELVAHHGAELRRRGLVTVETDAALLLAMLDKQQTYDLAADAGIAVPESQVVEDETELRAVEAEVAYPCALKPAFSHVFNRHFRSKGFVVRNRNDLERAFQLTRPLGIKMMVTELVPGPDDAYPSCYSYLDETGEPLFVLTKRKLRQYPIGFGSACYHVTDWDRECAELGVRFLRSIGLRGLANVEFKRDARDGSLKLIECNPRFTGTAGLFRAAGVDLPLFTYNRLQGRPQPPVDEYRRGMAMWWPLNDFRAFRAYRRRGELSLRRWVASLLRPQVFPLASWRDPAPTCATLARRIASRLQKRGRPISR